MYATTLGRRIKHAPAFRHPKTLLLTAALAAQCLLLSGCERPRIPVAVTEVHPAPGSDFTAAYGGVMSGDLAGELIEHPDFVDLAAVVEGGFKACFRKALSQPILDSGRALVASAADGHVRIEIGGGRTVAAVCDGVVTAATTLDALPVPVARWVASRVGDVGTAIIHTGSDGAAAKTEVAMAAQLHKQIEAQMRFQGARLLGPEAQSASLRSGEIQVRNGVLHRVSSDGAESAIPLGSDVVRLLAVMGAGGHETLLVGVQAEAMYQGGAPVMHLRVIRVYEDRTEVASTGGWIAYSNAPITIELDEQGVAMLTAPTPEGLMRLSLDAGWVA